MLERTVALPFPAFLLMPQLLCVAAYAYGPSASSMDSNSGDEQENLQGLKKGLLSCGVSPS
jgi:hypothetical protein